MKKNDKKTFKSKGEHGYIGFMKFFNMLITIALFCIAAAIFLIGLWVNDGNKGNIWTIIAAIFVIPAARYLTQCILFLPFKDDSDERYEEVLSRMKGGNVLYCDVVITSTQKAMGLSYIVVTGNRILMFATGKKDNPIKIEEYVSDFMKRHAFEIKVSCTDDYAKFCNFLSSADSFAEIKFSSSEERTQAEEVRREILENLESIMV